MKAQSQIEKAFNAPIVRTLAEVMPDPVTDQVDTNTQYVGYAALGTADTDLLWLIKRVLKTGTVTRTEYVNGDPSFAYAWSNRAAYSYAR